MQQREPSCLNFVGMLLSFLALISIAFTWIDYRQGSVFSSEGIEVDATILRLYENKIISTSYFVDFAYIATVKNKPTEIQRKEVDIEQDLYETLQGKQTIPIVIMRDNPYEFQVVGQEPELGFNRILRDGCFFLLAVLVVFRKQIFRFKTSQERK